MTIHEAPVIDRGEAGGPADQLIAEVEAYTAHNYHPLPVVLARGEGAWVEDVAGKRYLDMLAGYSALNFGHCNPVLVAAAERQLGRLTLTSRAFHNDLLGVFGRELAALCGMDAILPMNTGAEAVETAVKMARKWGYQVKGVPEGKATIVVMGGNFHGRTTTIISFSDDPAARAGFGPYTPGFVSVPYGDAAALAEAIDENTVAVLLEPIQGEGGVIIPPDGFLVEVRRLCTERNVLMLADEIQSGLGRTGKTFACEHEGVVPDAYILGKALGGGILPVSAVVARADVMGVFHPVSTAARSAATRSPARSGSRSSGCWRRASPRRVPGSSARSCGSSWTRCPRTACRRCARAACGRASTSSAGRVATCARA